MENENYSSGLGDITINLKNIFFAINSRKFLILKIFTCVLLFFIALTFIQSKTWKVEADLYINKANGTNFMEVNPYAMEEVGNLGSILGNKDPLANELELIQSPRVIDKVIKENNLKYKKIFGIIPTAKTGEFITTEKFLKKKILFENKKGTNILAISYTGKDKDEAYNVVNSIIKNYIKLYQELNSKKSKTDKAIIESEYKKAKEELNKKMSTANGLPSMSFGGTGNLTAMSSFSRSAQNALSNIKGQYVSGEKSRIAVTESAEKVSQLAQKLEWANLVDEMSDSSKVLVIKEPYKLRNWEYASPKLFINILLGIVFGFIFSFIAVIYKEITDKKLSYSMLGNDVIYDLDSEFNKLSSELISYNEQKIALVYFEDLSVEFKSKLNSFVNLSFVKADITPSFKNSIKLADNVVLLESINKTNSQDYKLLKRMIENMDKKILYEVLISK